jgi:hypothetical protein
MSFSAGIVQGRQARSGFGLLDGGDLGPTRCAVTKRGPHEGTHRAPIICQACHQTPLFLPAKRASRVFATDRIFSALATLRYRASASSPTSRTLRAARRTPAGCGVTKHVLVAHVPEPQDPDGVTELARFGSRFGDHVVHNPEADVPELPGFALYREARAAVLRCVSKQGVFLIRPDGYIRLARPFVPRART